MNILVSCGNKTDRIIEALKNKFGFDITTSKCEYISDINDFINKGGDFDRVIIMEQSLTHDGKADSFEDVEDGLTKLVEAMNNLGANKAVEAVCVMNTEETAALAKSELFTLSSVSEVLLHPETKYKMKFLCEITTAPINGIKANPVLGQYLYEEENIQSTIDYSNSINDSSDDSGEGDTFGEDAGLDGLMGDDNSSDDNLDDGFNNFGGGDSDEFGESLDNSDFGESDFGESDFGESDFGNSEDGFGGFDSNDDAFGSDSENSNGLTESDLDDFGSSSDDFGGFGDDSDDNLGDSSMSDTDASKSDLGFDDSNSDSNDSLDAFGTGSSDDSFGTSSSNDDFGVSSSDDFGAGSSDDFGSSSSEDDFGASMFEDSDDNSNNFGVTDTDFENNDLDDKDSKDNNLDGSSDDLGGSDFDTSEFGDDLSGFGAGWDEENDKDVNTDTSGSDDEKVDEAEFTKSITADLEEVDELRNQFMNNPVGPEGVKSIEKVSFDNSDVTDLFEEDKPKEKEVEPNEEDSMPPLNSKPAPPQKKGSLFGNKGQKPMPPRQVPPRPGQKAVPQPNRKVVPQQNRNNPVNEIKILNDEIAKVFKYSKGKGKSILVTGTRNSGTSTIVANLANVISKLGFTALVVDLDFTGRAQSFINSEVYSSIHTDDPNLESVRVALNTKNMNFINYTTVVKQGYNVLATGLGADIVSAKDIVKDKDKTLSFMHAAASTYDAIIYDARFDEAIGPLSTFVVQCDYDVISVEPTSKGLMEFMTCMCNIEDTIVREKLFNSAKLIFNKATNQRHLLGKGINTYVDALATIDKLLYDMSGYNQDFKHMNIIGEIPYNLIFDKYMFSPNFASDKQDLELLFKRLLKSILID